ncbi:hypothetical protein [Halalkalibacterium halodurans]|uniref:Uncharacterized protein n=1 Tax=Halalkalibacterium halodurans TaxID=86665 RepID=A0A0M0KIC0_ALKHA|nr:hypothetical protein [Halalkalibacterium halodurans]TPE68023.1 hypothetical protein AMD02_015795 [Halalkalibacterium halodurans]
MPNYKILKTFKDKFTKKRHVAGSVYKTDAQRGAELQEKGYLGEEVQAELLSGNVKEIKQRVTKQLGQKELLNLLELEKNGDKRKSVLAHIESLLGDEDGHTEG